MVWFMAWIMAWHGLHVVVLIWMLLRAMVLETSSACVHSPPSSQALTAALHVIVAIAMLLRAMLLKAILGSTYL